MSSFVQYVASGGTDYTVPFAYVSQSHVKVKVGTLSRAIGVHFDFVGSSLIRFRTGFVPVVGAAIELRRETPNDTPLVVYQNSAVLGESDLNSSVKQLLLVTQELKDTLDARLRDGLSLLTNGGAATAQQMVDAVVQGVLSSQALALFSQGLTTVDSLQDQIDVLTSAGDWGTLAQDLSLLGARNGAGDAFILDMSTVRVDSTTSLGTRLSGIDTSLAGNSAAIASEATARTTADSALASAVTTLQATAGSLTSSVTTLQSVVSGTGGLAAQYMVKLDVNGHVSGLALYNSGTTSDFIIQADRFAIVHPGLTAPVVPFTVVDGVVYMEDVVALSATVSSLSIDKLTAAALGADMALGAGKITLTAAGRSMYLGSTGIGAANEYVQWFGPTPVTGPVGATDGPAKFYIKNNGDAYFGGTLGVGTVVAENIVGVPVSKLTPVGESVFVARAWARFYGNASSCKFTRAHNVASVSRFLQGRYQFTFANPMPNRLYVVIATGTKYNDIDNPTAAAVYDVTTSGFKIGFKSMGGNYDDVMLGQIVVYCDNDVVSEPPPAYTYVGDPNQPIYNGEVP